LPGTKTRKELPFARREYTARLERVAREIEDRHLDALLVFDPVSQNYLTGYQTMELTHFRCLLVSPKASSSMVTSNFERPGVELTSCVDDVSEYHYLNGDYLGATLGSLSRLSPRAKRVGIEKDAALLTPVRYEGLLAALRGVEIVDSSDLVRKLRRVKSTREVDYVRKASAITSDGMRAAVAAVEPGAKDSDVASAAYRVMTEAGSEYMCYAPFVTTGRRSGVPHTTFMGNTILKDDIVFIELGACVRRYSGPLMRTVGIGSLPARAKTNAASLLEVLDEVIDAIEPGLSCSQVARKVQRRGFKPVGSRVISPSLVDGDFGYGIGLGFPPDWGGDGPLLSPGDETILEPGMTFHLNETFREVARYGLSFSETVVVTKSGCEVLTQFPREFLLR
jgi:Xaa-Pro aminopeptidase